MHCEFLFYSGDVKQNDRTKDLKAYYANKLDIWKQAKPLKRSTGKKYTERKRSEVFVDLVLGNQSEVYDDDREHYLRGLHQQKESIQMHNLLDGDDQLTIISGIAGIGKTSFVDALLLNWADDKCYQDFAAFIKLDCRKLNVSKDYGSIEALLNDTYKDQELSRFMCDALNNSELKVLFILDGLDEFSYLQDIIDIHNDYKEPTHKTATAVHKLICPDPGKNNFVVALGRPKATDTIRQYFEKNTKCKLIEITGFSAKNADVFIDNHFEDAKLAGRLKGAVSEDSHLQAMIRIPVYAYILCNVYKGNAFIDDKSSAKKLDTTTKLNIAMCLVFLRDHMRRFDETIALIKLCEDDRLIKTITTLSKFAYKSLEEGKILFHEHEFSQESFFNRRFRYF